MRNILSWGLAGFYLLTGLLLVVAPLEFYENAPGVTDTGPFNMHFIRDVGFAFTVSAVGIAAGLKSHSKPLVLFGTSWLTLHGLFHLLLWFMHAEQASAAAFIDLVVVVLPAALITCLAITYAADGSPNLDQHDQYQGRDHRLEYQKPHQHLGR